MRERVGDLLAVNHGIIVHGCNAQGVMGSGVAKAIRSAFPGAWEIYRDTYESKGLTPGEVVWFVVRKENPPLAIANAITQKYYGRDGSRVYVDYEAMRNVFHQVGLLARKHQLPVHYPKIGAGLANGDWERIASIIEQELKDVSHTLWVQTPSPAKAARNIKP